MNQHGTRRAIIALAFIGMMSLTLFPGRVTAQIFLTQEDMENSLRAEAPEDFVIPVPYEGGDADEFLPLGGGVWLLTGLGGAYLLSKRRKRS